MSIDPPTVRVAWLMSTPLAPYRVPLLARLGADPELELTVYHGGTTPPGPYGDISVPPTVKVVGLKNVMWPGRRPRAALQRGAWRVLEQPVDVVIVPDVTHNLTSWMLLMVSKLRGRRAISFGYGTRPGRLSPKWALGLRDIGRRVMMRLADAAVTYTEEGARGATSMGMPASRAISLNNTLDVAYLTALADSESTAAKAVELGVADRPVLLFVGRLQNPKRVDLLVASFSVILTEHPDAVLIVVGAGEESWRLVPDQSTIVLPDIYDPRELAPLFGLADLLVIPGRIGLTCVHAFAYGVPSVTCARDLVEQSPEYAYLQDGVNAVIVQKAEADTFAAAVSDLLTNRERLNALSHGALQTARDLDMDQMASRLKQALTLPPRHRGV